MKPWFGVWLIAVFFGFWETAHFGEKPLSDAEIICDGIAMLIMALSFVTYAIEQQRTKVTVHNNL